MKKIIIAASVVLLLVTSSIVSKQTFNKGLLDLNVEALAGNEVGDGTTCYNTITTAEGMKVLYCQDCKYHDGTKSFFSGKGKCAKVIEN